MFSVFVVCVCAPVLIGPYIFAMLTTSSIRMVWLILVRKDDDYMNENKISEYRMDLIT